MLKQPLYYIVMNDFPFTVSFYSVPAPCYNNISLTQVSARKNARTSIRSWVIEGCWIQISQSFFSITSGFPGNWGSKLAIKYVLGRPLLTSTSLLYSDSLLPISKLHYYESILFIYKVIHRLIDSDYQFTTNLSVTGRVTRQSNLYRPPNYVLGLAQNSIFYSGVKLYNQFIQANPDSSSLNLTTLKSV
jgi:hypothetical protein